MLEIVLVVSFTIATYLSATGALYAYGLDNVSSIKGKLAVFISIFMIVLFFVSLPVLLSNLI